MSPKLVIVFGCTMNKGAPSKPLQPTYLTGEHFALRLRKMLASAARG